MKKPFGQHFLFDPNLLRKIADSACIRPDDTVVEVGPGLGTLTNELAKRAKKVISIELDKRLIDKLKENLADRNNVKIVRTDALKFPYDSINSQFRVVANIPYYITTPLIFRFLEYKDKVLSMTLLMQKEVAKRITAVENTKDYGVLSISLQLYTNPSLKFTVSKKAFSPPPEVDSAVVHFEIYEKPLFDLEDEELFMQVVRTAFSQRRKTIINGLKPFDRIKEALDKAGIDPKLRPENLSIENFVKISNAIQ